MFTAILVLTSCHARDESYMSTDVISPGVFSTEEKAVQSLFKEMLTRRVISPICQDCQNDYEDCSCDQEKDLAAWGLEISKTLETVADLESICNKYGDSYYKQHWRFQVLESTIDPA